MHRFLAAIMFFTRLPLWRIVNVPPEAFKRLVNYWSLTGWLTGGAAAATLWISAMAFPLPLAAVIAMSIRLILTGALHEDGFADFFDGMGGGGTRERILAIMKDSHIGSYGVISLIVYFLSSVLAIGSMPVGIACATMLAADTWSKFCASQIINTLPYARKVSEAKNHTIYERMSAGAFLLSLVAGALPLLAMPGMTKMAALAPMLTTALLIAVMHRRLGGYTGDCCGATFLIGELAFTLTAAAIIGHV